MKTAFAQLPVAYPIVNSTPAAEARQPARNHKNPVTSISGPIRLSGRRRQAIRPATTNAHAVRTVSAAVSPASGVLALVATT